MASCLHKSCVNVLALPPPDGYRKHKAKRGTFGGRWLHKYHDFTLVSRCEIHFYTGGFFGLKKAYLVENFGEPI